MKNIKWITAVAVLMALTGCQALEDLNQDPTRSTSVNPDLLVPTIQFMQSYGYNNCTRHLIYPGAWCNYFTGAWSQVEYGGKGKKQLTYMERLWNTHYQDIVWNLTALEEICKENPAYVNFGAMAKVLRVEVFMKLTDSYGDVPYFDAGKAYFGGILNPTYDKQEDIYNDFFRLLDEAVDQFDATQLTSGSDLYYQGNVDKWIRLANSLKLRAAMRLVKINPDLAKQKAKEALEAGVMTSNDDIAYVKHNDDTRDEGPGNGFANVFTSLVNASYGPTQIRVTTELLKALSIPDTDFIDNNIRYRRLKAEDPRLLLVGRSYWGETMATATDITIICRDFNATASDKQSPLDPATSADGVINIGGYLTIPAQEFCYGSSIQREDGYNNNRDVWAAAITNTQVPSLPTASVSHHFQRLQPSKWLQAASSPWIHMTYAETQFLLAETTLRGWNIDTETVKSRFEKGYTAAVKQWSLFDAPVPADNVIKSYLDDYLNPILAQSTDAAMEEVAKQLWLLFIMDPVESWSLIRRTDGKPTPYVKFYNRTPTENETGGLRPRRLQYPLEEQSKNRTKYDEAIQRMGGTDDWMTPVWWDKQ